MDQGLEQGESWMKTIDAGKLFFDQSTTEVSESIKEKPTQKSTSKPFDFVRERNHIETLISKRNAGITAGIPLHTVTAAKSQPTAPSQMTLAPAAPQPPSKSTYSGRRFGSALHTLFERMPFDPKQTNQIETLSTAIALEYGLPDQAEEMSVLALSSLGHPMFQACANGKAHPS